MPLHGLGGIGGNPAGYTLIGEIMNNPIPYIPAFKPDPALVQQVRAVVDRIRLAKLKAAVSAARKVA